MDYRPRIPFVPNRDEPHAPERGATHQMPTKSPLFPLFLLLLALSSGLRAAPTTPPPTSARERISLDRDWRFQKDDPPGNTVSLLYDVRPELTGAAENKVADARPEEAKKLAATHQTVLKP